MKKLFMVMIVAGLFCLTGCLEWHEIIQWNNDGSIHFTLRISIPQFPEKDKKGGKKENEEVEEDIQQLLQSAKGKNLTLLDQKDQEVAGLKVFSLKLKAQKLTDINLLYKEMSRRSKEDKKGKKKKEGKEEFEQLFAKSPYRIKKTKNNTIKVSRSFKPPKTKKTKEKHKKKGDLSSKQFEELFLNMFRFRFEVFAPGEVVESNAQQVYGRDLRWETTMGYLTKNPFEMRYEIPAPPEK